MAPSARTDSIVRSLYALTYTSSVVPSSVRPFVAKHEVHILYLSVAVVAAAQARGAELWLQPNRVS